MGQYEQIQTRKAISAYGGVGSILETRDGAIMVEPFDRWAFFERGQFTENDYIHDNRFKNRLSKYFQQLKYLIKVPVNELKDVYEGKNRESLLAAHYFPKWFYCNKCKRFDHIDNWKRHWENLFSETEDKEKFYPPKCFKCYLNNKDKKKKFFELEQVRFILIAPNGDIADIPWDKWAFLKEMLKQQKESEEKQEEIIKLGQIEVPDEIELYYKTSDKLDDLKGIWIIAENRKGEKLAFGTLSGLFNVRIKIEDLIPNITEKDILFKPVIRSSNSVYYPNILSSIFIPANEELTPRIITLIKEEFEDGSSPFQISKNLKRYENQDINARTIQILIDNNFSERESEISKSENEYRYDEYNFITTKDSERIGNDLIFEKVSNDFFQNNLIKSIYKMDKIKMTFVQTSYTRQEPIYTDLYLTDEVVVINTKPKEILSKRFTSRYGKNTKHLPAVESFGEGIFFDFDNDVLDEWLKNFPQINDRLNIILENLRKSESPMFKNFELTPKFILIHTFSHLIIKELEYLCGYPSTSIQERLYIDEKLGMYGVLIYTISGSEGSYGGLTSLCENEKIGKLIQSAMTRARDCATDPICYHTSGQGVGNLNLSACFSCTLLPETSCEMFNCFLDRRILVDKDYGYFKMV